MAKVERASESEGIGRVEEATYLTFSIFDIK